jgi:hypothetical protein
LFKTIRREFKMKMSDALSVFFLSIMFGCVGFYAGDKVAEMKHEVASAHQARVLQSCNQIITRNFR